MRYRRLQTLGFAALLATLTATHCIPTEAQADRRRRWTTHGSDRGRLVVACDMRSATCSDGRQITTTRSTPVPCETYPGVWEMVPENTACISYRGLESWASTTSYLSYGAELGRSPWTSGGAAGHVVRVYDVEGTNRMCQEAPLSPTSPAGRYQLTPIPTDAGTNTLSCIARPNTGSNIRLNAGDSSKAAVFPMEPGWARYTHSTEVEEGQGDAMSVYTLGQTCIDITGCWYTKTSTPGRACWGGEAPVTCADDQHTVSTDGWPTTHGSIEVVFRIDEAPSQFAIILDSRSIGDVGFNIHYERATGRLNHRQNDQIMEGPTITLGTWYRVRLEREGGDVRMYVNGVLVAAESDWPAWSYTYQSGAARLGRHAFINNHYTNGPIRSLTVRSYEVSP